MEPKVEMVCRECSDKIRKEFQKTNYIDTLRKAQFEFDKEAITGTSNVKYILKFPMQYINTAHNDDIDRDFYINIFDENSDDIIAIEHIWMVLGNVNFETKTVCGMLINKPIYFNLKEGDIVIANFKDIEDIEAYYDSSLNLN